MRALAALFAVSLALVGARVGAAPIAEHPRIAAAGDIACDPTSPAYNAGRGTPTECRQLATSRLLGTRRHRAVLAVGDLQYADGAYDKFRVSYARSWGRVKAITKPVPGNHEYETTNGDGYFRYFGKRAGSAGKGYYSFDVGSWHIVALNSNCGAVGGCHQGSPQERWLRRDLAANRTRCTLAYWHQPRFSSGVHGSDSTYVDFWKALYSANADVVLNGHDHDYERFAPQDPRGALDRARGIRQFVVGTGGRSLRSFPRVEPNSEARDATTFGVLELTLRPAAYVWRFLPAVGSYTDRGSAGCH
jgi:acid phosphatase type 7